MKRHEFQDELDVINRRIYEYSEIEGELERISQFVKTGGFLHRFIMWGVKINREKRLELRRIRDEIMR